MSSHLSTPRCLAGPRALVRNPNGSAQWLNSIATLVQKTAINRINSVFYSALVVGHTVRTALLIALNGAGSDSYAPASSPRGGLMPYCFVGKI